MKGALRTLLLSKSAITNLLGAATYVCSWPVPEGWTAPYIVLQLIVEVPEYHGANEARLTVATLQVDCYATTSLAAGAVAEQVRMVVGGYSGTIGTVKVQNMTVQAQREMYEGGTEGSQEALWRRSIDLRCAYEQAAPTH